MCRQILVEFSNIHLHKYLPNGSLVDTWRQTNMIHMYGIMMGCLSCYLGVTAPWTGALEMLGDCEVMPPDC
jgi:hypothetical protein